MADAPEFSVTARSSERGTVVVVAGEIDLSTSPEIGIAVRHHLTQGPVVVDLSQVVFLDSSGVHTLDALVREAQRNGHTLTFAPTLQENVRELLTMTGMLEELPFET